MSYIRFISKSSQGIKQTNRVKCVSPLSKSTSSSFASTVKSSVIAPQTSSSFLFSDISSSGSLNFNSGGVGGLGGSSSTTGPNSNNDKSNSCAKSSVSSSFAKNPSVVVPAGLLALLLSLFDSDGT
eukprot:TRINITY_DN6559_c0_g1_i1.p1 TRINITY_DN6559_c0_g1~~TRINITY_DN6559_c0_g1_i1.p1  ORF type:complete len:126 (+),score=33.72 TRINITY_DN6559_c0_g1_i1:75-452(+)